MCEFVKVSVSERENMTEWLDAGPGRMLVAFRERAFVQRMW